MEVRCSSSLQRGDHPVGELRPSPAADRFGHFSLAANTVLMARPVSTPADADYSAADISRRFEGFLPLPQGRNCVGVSRSYKSTLGSPPEVLSQKSKAKKR